MISKERVIEFVIDKDDVELLCQYLRTHNIKIVDLSVRQQIGRYLLSLDGSRLLFVLMEFLKDPQPDNLDSIISGLYEKKRIELLKDLLSSSSVQEEKGQLIYCLFKNKGRIPANLELSDESLGTLINYAIQNGEFLDWLFDYWKENDFELAVRLHREYLQRSSGTRQHKNLLFNLLSPEPEVLFQFYKSLSNDAKREDKFWQIVKNFSASQGFQETWMVFLVQEYRDKNDHTALLALKSTITNAENALPYKEKGCVVISKLPLELVLKFQIVDFFVEQGEFDALSDVFVRKYNEEFPQEFVLGDFLKYHDDLGEYIKIIPLKRRKEFSGLFSYYENINFFIKNASGGRARWFNGFFGSSKSAQQGGNSSQTEFSKDEYLLVFQICELCAAPKKDESQILEIARKFQDGGKKVIVMQFLGINGIKTKRDFPISQEDLQNLQTQPPSEVTTDRPKLPGYLFWLVVLVGLVSFIIFAVLLFSAFGQLQNLFLAIPTIVSLGLAMVSFAIFVLMFWGRK